MNRKNTNAQEGVNPLYPSVYGVCVYIYLIPGELTMVLLYYASQYFAHQRLKPSQRWQDFSLSF